METLEHTYHRCQNCGSDQNLVIMRFCGTCGHELGVKCVRCGATNLAGEHRCAACGASLPRACPKCHALYLPTQQYCGTCAFPLHDTDTPDRGEAPFGDSRVRRERRKVSVLFADISRFTELSNSIDTEEIYFLVDRALRRLASEVRRYGGTVDKFTGDGLMAIFGAPAPLEQHALHAVSAAMSMQTVMQHYAEGVFRANEELQGGSATELRIRIGINAGEVIAGEVGSDHFRAYTVIGDTVNLASRLEEAARPGHILVSKRVYEATNAAIEYRDPITVEVKGYDQPVVAYEVVGLRDPRKGEPKSLRGLPGLQAPLIGRDAQLEELLSLIASTHGKHKRGGVAFLTGDAGIGKSRLLREFASRLSHDRVRTLIGHCSEHTQGIPYSLFTDLLARYFELPFGQSPELNRRQIRTRLQQRINDATWQEMVPFLEHLLSIGRTDRDAPEGRAAALRNLSPEQVKLQMFRAVRRLLRAEARRRRATPLLLILEDLHWADELSLELLRSLLFFLEDTPILICCVSRPVSTAATPSQAKGREETLNSLIAFARRLYPETMLTIELRPLSRHHTEQLLDELLNSPVLPAHLREEIIAHAEGIPLYLEELLRALIEAGVLFQTEDGWVATTEQSLDTMEVPQTLHEIVMARYSGLPAPLRETLALAAVIGRHVPYQLLEASLEQPTREPLVVQLERLEEVRLLRRRTSSPHLEFSFRNLVAQQAIYESLFTKDRQRLHLQIATTLERLTPTNTDNRVELLAYHFQRSSDRQRAFPYLIRAGEKAAARFANKEAVQFYQQAKALASPEITTDEQMIALESGLGDVLTLAGDYHAAREAYLRALTFAEADTHEPHRIASLFRRIAITHERRGDYDQALKTLDASLEWVKDRSDAAARYEAAKVYSDIGWTYFRQGELTDANARLMEALKIARTQTDETAVAAILNRLGGVAFLQGDLEAAVDYTQEALQIRKKLGHLDEIARSSTNLAVLHSKLGDWSRATQLYKQACEMHEHTGDLEGLVLASINLGTLYTLMGEFREAENTIRRSRDIANRLASPFLDTLSRQALARLHIARQEWRQAENVLMETTATDDMIPITQRLINLGLLTEIYASHGDVEAVQSITEQVRKITTENSDIGSETMAIVHRIYGTCERLQGRWHHAGEELQQSAELFADDPFEQARTRVEQALVARDRGDDAGFARKLRDAERVFERLGAQAEVERIQRLRSRSPLRGLRALQGSPPRENG